MNFAYYFSQKFYFPMKLDKINTEELMELIELVIEDDTHLQQSLCSSNSNNFYSKEELRKTIDEISSTKMRKVFEKKLKNFTTDRKIYLMEKYGKFFLNERLIRSVLDLDQEMKKKYSMFKKYY